MKEKLQNNISTILLAIILIVILMKNGVSNKETGRFIFSPGYSAESEEILDTHTGTVYIGSEEGKWVVYREVSNQKYDFKDNVQAQDSVAVDTTSFEIIKH